MQRQVNRKQGRRLALLLLFFLVSMGVAARARSQSALKVEHGLMVPNGHTPWAVDRFSDQPQLVPIHHSTIAVNNHTGANIAGSLAGSFFYKPKVTTELDGTSSRNQLHSRTPVFYFLVEEDEEPGAEAKDADLYSFQIVRVTVAKGRRVVDNLAYTQLTGKAKRSDSFVESVTTKLPGGWIRIETKDPMDEGEYCLLPVPAANGTFATRVYDFGIHADAPNAKDAVAPGKGQ